VSEAWMAVMAAAPFLVCSRGVADLGSI
jgi:hypothetical protein